MIKRFISTALVAAAMTAGFAGTSGAQSNTNEVTMTVPTSNSFSVSGSASLSPAAIATGADSSIATDATASYSVTTNTGGTSAGKVTAFISAGAVVAGADLKVLFGATGGNTASEQLLDGSTSETQVTVLDGLANESVSGGTITYKLIIKPAAIAASNAVTVTYTYVAGT